MIPSLIWLHVASDFPVIPNAFSHPHGRELCSAGIIVPMTLAAEVETLPFVYLLSPKGSTISAFNYANQKGSRSDGPPQKYLVILL